jgi:hypothetical protein
VSKFRMVGCIVLSGGVRVFQEAEPYPADVFREFFVGRNP